MDPELRAYLDQFAASIAGEFERINKRFDTLEARMDRLEERVDQLEKLVGGMHLEFTDKFRSLEERFDTLTLRVDQFEDRITASVTGVRHDVTLLSLRVDGVHQQVTLLVDRTGKVETGLVNLNGRVDSLADATRQRFRSLN
jgi:SMC interacting uncharacterized protein involved in chromosome segregation